MSFPAENFGLYVVSLFPVKEPFATGVFGAVCAAVAFGAAACCGSADFAASYAFACASSFAVSTPPADALVLFAGFTGAAAITPRLVS